MQGVATRRRRLGLRVEALPVSAVPYAAIGLAASLAQLVGGWWDVSWHAALGRESFWSPPHLLIYAGVVALFAVGMAGLMRGAGATGQPVVRLPWLGAAGAGFAVAALGPLVQLVSAPFDELWHRLYGIDVTIWSPPHLLLIAGIALAPLGLALALGPGVRAGLPAARPLALGLFTAALLAAAGALGEVNGHVWTRDSLLYPTLSGLLLTPPLLAAALVAGPRLAATTVVLLFIVFHLVVGSGLDAAIPHPHPPAPPPMLLLPALAIDLVVARAPHLSWRGAALVGAAFGPLFLALDAPVTHIAHAAQWPEVAPYLAGPFPPNAPRPQLPVAVPWTPAAVPVALVAGTAASTAGGVLGRAVAQLGAHGSAARPRRRCWRYRAGSYRPSDNVPECSGPSARSGDSPVFQKVF